MSVEKRDDGVTLFIDSSKREGPDIDKCPDHPDAEQEMGYGLAGGGMGVYTYCSICGRVLTKTMDQD